MKKMSVTRQFVDASARGKKPKASDPQQRVPRVAKLMALAIVFDQMIRDGIVVDQAELATVGLVTRARLTQIMNLLNLAPAIQEQILCLPMPVWEGVATTERSLRAIASTPSWQQQVKAWRGHLDQVPQSGCASRTR